MRFTSYLPVVLLLAAAEVTASTPHPSPTVTALPTASSKLLSTFITTAFTASDDPIVHQRDPKIVITTSTPVVATSTRPGVFTTTVCFPYGQDAKDEPGYVKHLCKVWEYKLKELESGAGYAVPLMGGVWVMVGLVVVTLLF